MCLYPKLIINKKYKPNKKNGWKAPICKDRRLLYVTSACGKCYECRKQNAEQWRIRMSEELKTNPKAMFVTLTINEDKMQELEIQCMKKHNEIELNKMGTIAIRHCLENYRKHNKKSVKHWFITERGHNGTERLHLHGIIYNQFDINKYWLYGNTYTGYVNESTITYIVKYITKEDDNFIGKVCCSPGLGANYTKQLNAERNKFNNSKTNETYLYKNGQKGALPKYYRNKLYTDEQREQLWIQKIENGTKWVCGEKVNINNEIEYTNLLSYYQNKFKKLNIDNPEQWDIKKYQKRLQKQRDYIKNHPKH